MVWGGMAFVGETGHGGGEDEVVVFGGTAGLVAGVAAGRGSDPQAGHFADEFLGELEPARNMEAARVD